MNWFALNWFALNWFALNWFALNWFALNWLALNRLCRPTDRNQRIHSLLCWGIGMDQFASLR
jgi:hypothetical protein